MRGAGLCPGWILAPTEGPGASDTHGAAARWVLAWSLPEGTRSQQAGQTLALVPVGLL